MDDEYLLIFLCLSTTIAALLRILLSRREVLRCPLITYFWFQFCLSLYGATQIVYLPIADRKYLCSLYLLTIELDERTPG